MMLAMVRVVIWSSDYRPATIANMSHRTGDLPIWPGIIMQVQRVGVMPVPADTPGPHNVANPAI